MYRLSQLSPQTNRSAMRVVVTRPGSASSLENFRNIEVWRSWIEFDSEVQNEEKRSRSRVNWNAVLGLAVTLGISAAFWTGVGILVVQIWK